MREILLAAVVACAACGGGDKKEADEPEPFTLQEDPDALEYEDVDDTMVPPEKFDEINLAMERRGPRVSRCYADAIESGALDRNAKGTVVVGLTILPSGQPQGVKVLPASSLKNDTVSACVVDEIGRVRFTTLPKSMPYTYTYKLERDY